MAAKRRKPDESDDIVTQASELLLTQPLVDPIVAHTANAVFYAGIVHEKAVAEEQESSPYQEYLASPQWQAIRMAMQWLANYRCQVCNRHRDKVILDTHHRTYERLGRERPEDLIVLCRDCHTLFHENGKLARG